MSIRRAVVAAALCLGVSGCGAPAHPAGPDTPGPTTDVPTTGPRPVPAPDPGLWWSWSLVDHRTGSRIGSPNSATERTNAESTMKAWIAADVLRRAAVAGRPVPEHDLDLIDRAIRHSDDQAAEQLYRAAGSDEVLRDLTTVCGVPVATARPGYWSYAQITAVDATGILDCVLRSARGYPDGDRLLADLHTVDPDGAFGIGAALPPTVPVAVKNGWTRHSGTGLWDVDCVASWRDYTLAVLTRYPAARSLAYGAGVCRDVAAQVVAHLP